MSNFDNVAENAALLAKFSGIAGGRVYEMVPAEDAIPKNADGSIKPFVVVQVGSPIASANDRTIMGERQQPQRIAATIVAIAATVDEAKPLRATIINTLLDNRLTTNASPMKLNGGYTLPRLDANNKPIRVELGTYWGYRINEQPDITA